MVSSVGEAFMKASEAIILYCILYIVHWNYLSYSNSILKYSILFFSCTHDST